MARCPAASTGLNAPAKDAHDPPPFGETYLRSRAAANPMTYAWDIAIEQVAGTRDQWPTPGDLAQHLTPGTVQTPALDLVDEALAWALTTPDARLIVTMAPQEGKSTRVASDFPIWALASNPDLRIITASYGQSLANRNGRGIRNRITRAPETGLTIARDHGAASEWSIAGRVGGVKSVGIGGGITGHACDLLIIDDPVRSWQDAYSETHRERVWDWWRTEAATRLAPGASVVLILTRWHHDDLAGRLVREYPDTWRVVNIPAKCDDPENDPLGRDVGEYMESARGRRRAQWEQREREAGPHAWAALYQGNPTPDTGNILPSGVWRRWPPELQPWIDRADGTRWIPDVGSDPDRELIQSWDLAFKGEARSDFVVGQVWLRCGPDAWLLDQVRGRWGFTETLTQMRDLSARWPQAVAKLVEDAANGPAVINALRHELTGLTPVRPEGSKVARAHAIAPLAHAGNLLLPQSAPWVGDLIEEAAAFPAGANDDQVDALTQAAHRLLLVPILEDHHPDLDTLTHGSDLDWFAAASSW